MSKFNIKKLVGKSVEKAEKLIPGTLKKRIFDKQHPTLGTCDYRMDRINLIISEGIIEEAFIG
jgi:hypothetical protein